jgi:hypothetical protein
LRAGYLAVLASRALGTVPTLRPVTPSRFEPTAPQPGLHEMVEVVEAVDAGGTDAQNAPRSSAAAPGEPALAGDEDRPLVSQLPAARDGRRLVRPDHIEGLSRPEPRDDEPGPANRPLRPDWQPAEVSDLVRAAAPDDGRVPTEVPVTLSEAENTVVTRTVRPPGREAARGAARSSSATAPPATGGDEVDQPSPTVVIRIGRVDVRAVPSPPPPAPAPAPRSDPRAGPSLADYLAARDSARR